MGLEQQFLRFLAAWSVVSLCNAVLNGYAGDVPSLPYRGIALGALLWLATVAHCLERKATGRDAAQTSGTRIERAVYVALFAANAVPSVAWRCLSPLDVSGLCSLNHGASIAFVFGTLNLLIARLATSGYLSGAAARHTS